MKFPSAPVWNIVLSFALFIGLFSVWPPTAVTADAHCDDASVATQQANDRQEPNQPCAAQDGAFSLMLPFVIGNGPQGNSPQQPADPTATPTPDPLSKPTLTPAPTNPSDPPPTPTDPSNPPPTPTAGATTSPTTTLPPTSTPTAGPTSGEILFDPPDISTLTQDRSGLSISWSGCDDGTAFRVIYGPNNTRPITVMTTQRSLTMPISTATGMHSFMVECYDSLGNSVFSSPRLMEVIR